MATMKISGYVVNKQDVKDAKKISELVHREILTQYSDMSGHEIIAKNVSGLVKWCLLVNSIKTNNPELLKRGEESIDELHMLLGEEYVKTKNDPVLLFSLLLTETEILSDFLENTSTITDIKGRNVK